MKIAYNFEGLSWTSGKEDKKEKLFNAKEIMLNSEEIKREELEPEYENVKSYYGKANVVTYDTGEKILISYETPVVIYENGEARIYDTYSATTMRHIKEFLRQQGLKADTKQQLIDDYGAPKA